MKKIIIVNNNLKVGGVQKSLCNLLWVLDGKYDITLYLFSGAGAYAGQLPESVKICTCSSLFRYLGVSQAECAGKLRDRLTRGVLAGLCRLLGKRAVLWLLLASQKGLPGEYDCAISFLHNGSSRAFYGGVNEFVLERIQARKKIAFLHCDYHNCGADHRETLRLYQKFDEIAACSDGCRQAFLEVFPSLADRCRTVANCHRFDEIRRLAADAPWIYEPGRIPVVSVGRLSREKGLERALLAVRQAIAQGVPVSYHLVGDGNQREALQDLAQRLGIAEYVRFHGEQSNPYRFMTHAALLLVTSYHEAAPMVIDEAYCLGLPVFSVRTTSSEEMITRRGCGWVCENSQAAIDALLPQVLREETALHSMKERLRSLPVSNQTAQEQFFSLVGR